MNKNKMKEGFVLSLIATIILPIFLGMFLEELLDLSVILAVGLILPIMITGLVFMRKPETSQTGGMIILIMGGIGIATVPLFILGFILGETGGGSVIIALLGAITAIRGGYSAGGYLAIKEKIKRGQGPFILSLIATVIFILPLFFWQAMAIESVGWQFFTVGSISLIISMMITGLLFMRKKETSQRGGTIILITGVAGMALIGPSLGHILGLGPAITSGSVVAVIGGWLAIKDERIEYSKAFIISTMGFVSALLSVFIFSWAVVEAHEWGIAFLQLFISLPLWIVSIILNIISTVVRSEETIPEKRAKILITVTWCLIALLVILLFLYMEWMRLR